MQVFDCAYCDAKNITDDHLLRHHPDRMPSRRHKTNADVVEQLEAIFKLATRDYPYSNDQPKLDGGMILALGQIAGIARKAIANYDAIPKT